MKATLDDAGSVRAALYAAEDPDVLVAQILAVLKRTSPGELRQLGAMGIAGGPVSYPIPNPCSDAALFLRVLDKHPDMAAEALRTVNEGSSS